MQRSLAAGLSVVMALAGSAHADDARADAGWQLYHAAFDALAAGDATKARGLLLALERAHPQHPAIALAQQRLAQLEAAITAPVFERPAVSAPPAPARESVVEQPSRAARAELALYQTFHGIAVGIELGVATESDAAGELAMFALTGAILGAVLPLAAVGDLTSGQRALLNSGTSWGALNAALAVVIADPESAPRAAVGLMAGQALGIGIGAGLFRARPTAGQVALANSGGQWLGGISTMLAYSLAGDSLSDQELAGVALLTTDVGIGAGGYLATRLPAISRAQTLVIDSGGIVGGIGGGALAVIITGDSGDTRTMLGLAAAGAVIGIGTAAYLTRDWGAAAEAAPALRTFVMPAATGQGAVAGVGGYW